MRRIAKVVVMGAAMAALAGCGSSAATYALPDGMYQPGNISMPFHDPLTATVAIHDNGFSPAQVRVPVNTTIVWVNDSTRAQSLTWTGGNEPNFQSGPIPPGKSFEIRMMGDGPMSYTSGKFNGGVHVGYPTRNRSAPRGQ